jgi:hypothetical protein
MKDDSDTWGCVAVPAMLLLYAVSIGIGKAIRFVLDLIG